MKTQSKYIRLRPLDVYELPYAYANSTNMSFNGSIMFFFPLLLILFYPPVLTYILGAQMNRLIETVRVTRVNLCFGWEISFFFVMHS